MFATEKEENDRLRTIFRDLANPRSELSENLSADVEKRVLEEEYKSMVSQLKETLETLNQYKMEHHKSSTESNLRNGYKTLLTSSTLFKSIFK